MRIQNKKVILFFGLAILFFGILGAKSVSAKRRIEEIRKEIKKIADGEKNIIKKNQMIYDKRKAIYTRLLNVIKKYLS